MTLTTVRGSVDDRFVADKAEAVLLDPSVNINLFIASEDGRGDKWQAVTGAAPGTYSDNSVDFCGTAFIPTGGDGSSAWIRDTDIVNVRYFGASVDSLDNSVAIQEAIDHWKTLLSGESADKQEYGSTLLFPGKGGFYNHSASLDFTAVRTKGAIVKFEGAALFSSCTGKAAVDTTHSRYLQTVNMQIVGDEANQPSIGLLRARRSDFASGNNSDNFIHRNLTIVGYFSVAGEYNYGSEVTICDTYLCWNYSTTATSWNNVFTRSNVLGITSDYQTILGAGVREESLNDNLYYGCDIRKNGDGHNILIDGVRHLMMQGYCAYGGTHASGNTKDYHVNITTDSASRSTDIDLDMHFEHGDASTVVKSICQYEHVSGGTNNTIYGLKVRDFATQAASFLRFKSDGVTAPQGVSALNLEGFMSDSFKPFSSDAIGSTKIYGGNIVNYNNSITAPNGYIDLSVLGISSEFYGEIQTFDPIDITSTTNTRNIHATFKTQARTINHNPKTITTIATGAVDIGSGFIDLLGEGSASDTLTTMNGSFFDGEEITLMNTHATNVITITHGSTFENTAGVDLALSQYDTAKYKYLLSVAKWLQV